MHIIDWAVLIFAYLCLRFLKKIPGKTSAFIQIVVYFIISITSLFVLFYTIKQVLQVGIHSFGEGLTSVFILLVIGGGIFFIGKKIYLSIINL